MVERGRTWNSESHVAKVGIFKEKLWLDLVESNLTSNTNVAFSFYNARVVLNVRSSNSKKQAYHFWLTFANSNHFHNSKYIFFYLL